MAPRVDVGMQMVQTIDQAIVELEAVRANLLATLNPQVPGSV
jgi:hypothetical protein